MRVYEFMKNGRFHRLKVVEFIVPTPLVKRHPRVIFIFRQHLPSSACRAWRDYECSSVFSVGFWPSRYPPPHLHTQHFILVVWTWCWRDFPPTFLFWRDSSNILWPHSASREGRTNFSPSPLAVGWMRLICYILHVGVPKRSPAFATRRNCFGPQEGIVPFLCFLFGCCCAKYKIFEMCLWHSIQMVSGRHRRSLHLAQCMRFLWTNKASQSHESMFNVFSIPRHRTSDLACMLINFNAHVENKKLCSTCEQKVFYLQLSWLEKTIWCSFVVDFLNSEKHVWWPAAWHVGWVGKCSQ